MAHTKKVGSLPNASIDFEKVQSNAKAGKDNVFEGATSLERDDKAAASTDEQKVLENAAQIRAEEAGREIDPETQALTDPAAAEEQAPAKRTSRTKRS